MSLRGCQTMGWLRSAVGVALLLAPKVPMRLDRREPTATDTLLMRTVGARDLVLGLGTVTAARTASSNDACRWTAVGLASDSLDAVISLTSRPGIGKRAAWTAGMLSLAFVCGDLHALRGSSAPSAGS